ncbi:serine/threonine-protein phosphatase 7 long form-like protein [Trifolium pratense]|uniref:Serine/threonine-protein phosphatase 7 long form-like protein n=1 Tax=Trifolium pratense TaxID=57577 RepID=A0A2K3PN75_TRIPR|nr:serine/threonine-protein phosphatase 7 long form-like protein [Trifolium pratense]
MKVRRGPLDMSVLYDYGAPVSNGGKMNSIIYFDNDFKWWQATMDTIGLYGLELTGYLFLDPALLSTFVERWHGETNSFHMPSGEMTVFCIYPLTDEALHLPIKGRLLDHKGIPTKTEGVDLMIKHIGSTREEAEHKVKTTKGAHARFIYLKELIEKHTPVVNKAEVDGDKDFFDRYKRYITRAYLLLLVGTSIFSKKANNNVDLTYLKYFINLDQVHTYAWGTAALAFLYRELTNAIVPSCKYVAGYMTLLQAWIYDYFVDTGGSLDTQYQQQYPRATKYDPTKRQSSQMAMRKMMDWLLPRDITWTPYKDHRDTITLHPDSTANIFDTAYRIDEHWRNYTNHVMTYDMLGSRATIPPDTSPGYMSWYFRISHPYIVCIPASLMQPMHVESDAAMLGRLASIRNILNDVMHNDEVRNGSRVYTEL